MLICFGMLAVACQDRLTEDSSPASFALNPGPLLFNEASGLHYHVFTTGGASAGDELPWIVALHGVGGEPERYAQTFAGIGFASRVYVLQGKNEFSRGGYDWAGAAPSDHGPYGPGIMSSAELVSTFVRDMADRDNNAGKALVTGFSQGSILTLALASHFPQDFRAAVPVSGWLPASIMPNEPPATIIPVRASHGALDETLPYDDTVHKISQLQDLGMDIRLYTFDDIGHQLAPEVRSRWVEVMNDLLYPGAEG